MFRQRFRLLRAEGAIEAEWVCADCAAPMVDPEDEEGGVVMDHPETCRYHPSNLAAGAQ